MFCFLFKRLDQEPRQVWVHDFHLALLPALIKAERPTAPVSVFWHIPWPSPDVWRILPERCEVLLGLLTSDVIVFQTSSHAEASSALSFPLPEIECCAAVTNQGDCSPDQCRLSSDLRACGERAGIRLGLGVDRLDYTKGLLKRLWALDEFFMQFPHFRGNFTFLQIAIPTAPRSVHTSSMVI